MRLTIVNTYIEYGLTSTVIIIIIIFLKKLFSIVLDIKL